jgi:2-polyprenyl-3-methyl-5-hydroxy-6-metoxy-1,4-benzoquinol methylase
VPYKERNFSRALVPTDLAITDSNYGATLALRRCRECSFIFAEGGDLSQLLGLYEKLSDPGYEGSQDSRELQMHWLIDRALAARPGAKTLLDIGAASGLLVKLAREQGLEAQGIEPSHELVAAAARLYGVELIQGSVPHERLLGSRFDVIFLADVIEHVPDPVGLLRDARLLLAADGVLVVATPDVGSLVRRLLGKRWWHFRLAHVGYFDAASLGEACNRAGLAVTSRYRAKWFFRVSYLAERVLRYLPLRAAERLLRTTTLGRRVGGTVVPLNLFDSWVFVCKRNCQHERRVVSAKGSSFWLCERTVSEPERFRKYPSLPVLRCAGFAARDEGGLSLAVSCQPGASGLSPAQPERAMPCKRAASRRALLTRASSTRKSTSGVLCASMKI